MKSNWKKSSPPERGKTGKEKEMESIVDILVKGILFVGILGVWYVILKLLLRLPGWNDSLGKPVIKIYYKK